MRWQAVVGVVLLLGGCGRGAETTGGGSASVACEPVGGGGGTEVPVTLDEWSVTPATATTPAGTVTFLADNVGDEPHELVVVEADDVASLPVDASGALDEAALEEGALVGEIEAFPAGERCPGTFQLSAGSYVLLCNLVEEENGEVESHLALGMHSPLEVTE
ncbi:MAG: hypothetical protein KY462_10455 [Actinobacteria bacterium]|nr:hypothetical protein [Actinomycetota bacterium]